jgi:CDP-glucose 4,6-dehydratase
VRDLELLERVLGEEEVDTVFHLAAQTVVLTALHSPLSTWETNVRGTWAVLEACRRHGAARVVVASSDKAYGAHDALPYTEDHELRARFPYDVSKACADLIARSYWHSFGLPVSVTRCANLYGGGDLNRSRLVPEAVAAAMAGRAPVIRSDGSPERDFLYVEDAVSAYLALAEALDSDGPRGEAFNAGWGRSWPVRDVVAAVCRAVGADVEPDIRGTGTPDGEIDRQFVDSSRLRALTGWEPRFDLASGLARTVAWYREHPSALG